MNMNLIESLQDENQQATSGQSLGWYEEKKTLSTEIKKNLFPNISTDLE